MAIAPVASTPERGVGTFSVIPPPLATTTRIEVRSHLPSIVSQPPSKEVGSPATEGETSRPTFLTGTDGLPLLISQGAALRGCAKLNLRLPTMRELAELAQSRGAMGILEIAQALPQTEPENLPWEHSRDGSEAATYFLVKALDPDGKQDLFYYNPRGYQAPSLPAERGFLLTSSLNELGITHGFGLNGANGVLGGQGKIASTTDQRKPQPGFGRCVHRKL
ncbi:MAG: hypothetical protein EOP11_13385 [Proteobacteria bacterium]|nr:MAG: hypothetical protein EOP11_13385 [Pseudomonadota bacterium]